MCCGQDTVTLVDQLPPSQPDKRANITASEGGRLYCNYFCTVRGGTDRGPPSRFKSEGKLKRGGVGRAATTTTPVRQISASHRDTPGIGPVCHAQGCHTTSKMPHKTSFKLY